MKHVFLFCFFFFLCCNLAEVNAQTYADIPGPENVLVIYKLPADTTDLLGYVSMAIMEYYQQARAGYRGRI